jgi:hypothetical protein
MKKKLLILGLALVMILSLGLLAVGCGEPINHTRRYEYLLNLFQESTTWNIIRNDGPLAGQGTPPSGVVRQFTVVNDANEDVWVIVRLLGSLANGNTQRTQWQAEPDMPAVEQESHIVMGGHAVAVAVARAELTSLINTTYGTGNIDNTDNIPAAAPRAIRGAGEWRVGVGAGFDIQPGRFLLLQDGTIGGSVRLATRAGVTTHTQEGHLFLINFSNRQYIDLEAGQFVTIARASIWNLDDTPEINQNAASFAEGQYLVGRDIPAGEFRAEQVGTIGGSVRIATSPNVTSHTDAGHVSLVNFTGQAFLTLEDGQFVTISRGQLVFLGA